MYNVLKDMSESRHMIKITRTILAVGFLFTFSAYLQAAEMQSAPATADNITPQAGEKPAQLQDFARKYREQGLVSQKAGDIETAMKYYQKALEFDPYYAAPYNDLGIIYEGAGYGDRAEENYLKAIEIDPNYLSAYTNLALFYENKRDLRKAAIYWEKRAQLGQANDLWTQKAAKRVEDLRVVMSATPLKDAREQEVIGFMKDISHNKDLLNKDDAALARDHFNRAQRYYDKGDLPSAFKEALDAQYLDQNNAEIETFLEKIQARALSR